MLTDDTFRRVMLAAQTKLGNSTVRDFPLLETSMLVVTLAIWVLNVVRRVLSLISITSAVFKLIPSREFRKVFSIVSEEQVLISFAKLKLERAGRVWKKMVVAEVRELNWRLERVVKSIKLNSLPMLLMVVLVRPVRRLTLLAVNEPVICPIPSRAIVPEAVSAIAMLPSKVEQLEMAVTSAWEVTVSVAVCVQADDWARQGRYVSTVLSQLMLPYMTIDLASKALMISIELRGNVGRQT